MKGLLERFHNLTERLVFVFCKLANGIVFSSILGIVLLLGFGVISRYVFNFTPAFYEELAKFCLIWMTFAGAVIGMEKKEHVAIEMLVDNFDGKIRKMLALLSQVLILVTAALISKYGLRFAESGTLGVFTSMDWLPLATAYASVSFGYIGISIIAFRNILNVLLGKTASTC